MTSPFLHGVTAKPIPQVLSRPNLILGGEREPVMITALMSVGIAMNTGNIPGILYGAGLWGLAMPLWRAMAKADPQMIRVYIRSLRYKRHYKHRSRPYRHKASRIAGKPA